MKSPIIFRIFKDNQLVGVKQFSQEQIVVGRNADVHLDLDSDQVSPIHCLIEQREGGFYVCDLGSSSGTFKNGQAVLDELIQSGDELLIGPFKLVFFVGIPKPKDHPVAVAPAVAATAASVAPPSAAPIAEPVVEPPPPSAKAEPTEMPPAAVVKTEEIVVEKTELIEVPPEESVALESAPPAAQEEPEVKVAAIPVAIPDALENTQSKIPVQEPKQESRPVIAAAAVKPEIRSSQSKYKKDKKKKTYAPATPAVDLRKELKPANGSNVEVIVAWKERILTSTTYRRKQVIRVNSGEGSLSLPDGLVAKGFPILDLTNGVRVNASQGMTVELVTSTGIKFQDELVTSGRLQNGPQGLSIRPDQNEMVCITLPGGNITVYIRYTSQNTLAPLIPVMLSGSEMTGLIMSIILVGMLAFYVSATTPDGTEPQEQEEVQRIAQVMFNKPPQPKPPVPPPPPPEPPPKVETPPPPPPKVAKVAEKKQDAQKKGPQSQPAQKNQQAAKAAEVAPKESTNRPKKFTSTRQGGAIKTGETEGSNAKSASKDLSKVGLFSAFGGGGSRAKIDKAYSGAGEVLGMADKATGTSGFKENRDGDDLGSRFKDSGAGGKGTATQGIAGIGTKGRSSGQAAYGATEGFGDKTSVAIEGGGFEESFDGTIDKEAIRRVIKAKLHEVKSCYERVLNTMPKGTKLEGKVVIGWEILAQGKTRNVRVKSSTLGNAQVENCVKSRLANWTFPEPPVGIDAAEVEAYPFMFTQAN